MRKAQYYQNRDLDKLPELTAKYKSTVSLKKKLDKKGLNTDYMTARINSLKEEIKTIRRK